MGLKTTEIKVFELMNDIRNPKILIVDDTQTNIDILVEALREDYKVGIRDVNPMAKAKF